MREHSTAAWRSTAAIAVGVLLVDQATKAWVLAAPADSLPLTLIPGFFDVVHSRNTGGVFGLLAGPPSAARRAFFIAATLAALAAMGFYLHRWGRESRLLRVALSLVAGGALGNLVDRVRFGSVVDFIDWHWRSYHWYTFNVADSAITAGALLLLAQSLLPEGGARRAGGASTAPGAPPPAAPPEQGP